MGDRPDLATRFKPGQSGNPRGRPKVAAEARELARQHGPRALERLVELIESDDERVALMAAKEILDRAYGKPVPRADEDDGESPATVKVVRFCWQDQDGAPTLAPEIQGLAAPPRTRDH